MQIAKQDIDYISYDYKTSQMIIKLKNKKLIQNFMRDEMVYNCSEKVFKESVKKWLKGTNWKKIILYQQ